MASADVARLHGDPEDPIPAIGDGILLDGLDEAAIDAFLDNSGRGRRCWLPSCAGSAARSPRHRPAPALWPSPRPASTHDQIPHHRSRCAREPRRTAVARCVGAARVMAGRTIGGWAGFSLVLLD
jgi:hypothetical protein